MANKRSLARRSQPTSGEELLSQSTIKETHFESDGDRLGEAGLRARPAPSGRPSCREARVPWETPGHPTVGPSADAGFGDVPDVSSSRVPSKRSDRPHPAREGSRHWQRPRPPASPRPSARMCSPAPESTTEKAGVPGAAGSTTRPFTKHHKRTETAFDKLDRLHKGTIFWSHLNVPLI